jgi:PAT family beta-lactamase induction signal transducer AmpG
MSQEPAPDPSQGGPENPYQPPEGRIEPTRRKVGAGYMALFALVYAVQGVVFAYFAVFNQGYMQAAGVSKEDIGLVGFLALLPFALKFIAAPISDRFNLLGLGHRKPYIVLGLLIQIGGLLALSWVNPGEALRTFTALAILTVVGLALFDTCTDGMVVDITPPEDRARVQGLLMFSRFITATLTTLAFGFWLERTGTGPELGYRVLWACAALTLPPLALAVFLPEPKRAADAEEFQWSALRVMIRPSSLVLIAFGAFYAVVAWGVEFNLPVYQRQLGYGEGDIGLFGSARTLGRAVGAILLPVGAAWLGRRWVLRIAIFSLALTEAGQALIGPEGQWTAGLLSFVFGIANGWTEALFYVMAMEASDPRMAASTYALFMAVSNLSVSGSYLFIRATALFDGRFPPTFVAAALLTCMAFFMIRPLSKLVTTPTSTSTTTT